MKNKIFFLLIFIMAWVVGFSFIDRRPQTQMKPVPIEKHNILPCAKEGETIGSAMWSRISCCSGLQNIVRLEYNDECASLPVPGAVVTCSDKCGNATCESWEDRCNCPQDCKKLSKDILVPKDDKELRSCTSSSDCQFVEIKNCCSCYEIINKKYANYWNSSDRQNCSELDIACEVCQYYENDLKAVCIDNTCQGVPK